MYCIVCRGALWLGLALGLCARGIVIVGMMVYIVVCVYVCVSSNGVGMRGVRLR